MNFLWWTLALIFFFLLISSLIGALKPSLINEGLKEGETPLNRKQLGLVSGMFTIFFLLFLMLATGGFFNSNHDIMKDVKEDHPFHVKQINKTPIKKNEFSVDNPVSDQYLISSIGFMENYYGDIKQKMDSNPVPNSIVDGKFFAHYNIGGWKRFDKIHYDTDLNKEKSEQYWKRTDVYMAWSSLYDFSGKYELYLKGNHSATDLKKVVEMENVFLKDLKKAKNHFSYYNTNK